MQRQTRYVPLVQRTCSLLLYFYGCFPLLLAFSKDTYAWCHTVVHMSENPGSSSSCDSECPAALDPGGISKKTTADDMTYVYFLSLVFIFSVNSLACPISSQNFVFLLKLTLVSVSFDQEPWPFSQFISVCVCVCVCVCMHTRAVLCLVAQSCLTLCNPMEC